MCVLPNDLLNIVTLFAWHRSVHNTIDELNFLCEVRKKIPAAFLCPVTVEFKTLLHVASPWYPGSPYVPMCTVRLLFWSRERFWICKYLSTLSVRNELHTYRAIMRRRARAEDAVVANHAGDGGQRGAHVVHAKMPLSEGPVADQGSFPTFEVCSFVPAARDEAFLVRRASRD